MNPLRATMGAMRNEITEKESLVEEFLTRGVEKIYPDRDFLRKKLLSGETLSMYLGIDPTGPTLHLGSVVPILKLAQFQKLGHKAVLLVGDFTATIGDPTDKLAARTPLTRKQVLENSKQYKKQTSTILDFGGKNPAKLKYNSKWLNALSMADIAKLLSFITYAQTIKRDMFQRRIAEGKDLYMNEFLYPALQGYDSVAMDVDGEVGGNDQTFNMLMGRDLLKRMRHKEKFIVVMKLLVDQEGKKMGKTEGNMVSLDEGPEEMFGKVMSWPDTLILPTFELCTTVPLTEITQIKADLAGGINPRDIKARLAETIVAMHHGSAKAMLAKKNFSAVFSKKSLPENIKEVEVPKEAALIDHLAVFAGSRTRFRRLVETGSVENVETGEKISDPFYKLNKNIIVRIGKHQFLKISVR